MIVRTDMFEEGDFYNLFTAADEPEKYFRLTGRGIPSGFQLSPHGWFDGLDVWYGDELSWGANSFAFSRYHRKFGAVDAALMWKAQYITPMKQLF